MRKLLRLIGSAVLAIGCLLASVDAQAQTSVRGNVVNTNGDAVMGASVILKGTQTGTSTDVNGAFIINVPQNATLVVSYLGYRTQEVNVDAQTILNIVLEDDTQLIDDVVVIGYGQARKEDLTGSVTAINEKDFAKGAIATPSTLLTGKIPGVQVTPTGGRAGAGNQIRIRGGASLNASNDPLIVIDGVPVANGGIAGLSDPLAAINPNDIATFTVLKDASATAIYGSRAANGVILITTKKGSKRGIHVDFMTNNSVSMVARRVNVLSADKFRDAVTEQSNLLTAQGLDGARYIAMLGEETTDWQNAIFRTAFSTDNNVGVSGNIANFMPFRVSVGFTHQEGILLTDAMDRGTIAANFAPSLLDDHLNINLNLKGTYTHSRFGDGGAIGAALRMDPTKPIKADGFDNWNGYWGWVDGETLNTMATRNPVGILNGRHDVGTALRSIGNIQVDYKIHGFEDLRANLNLGYDISNGQGSPFTYPWSPANYPDGIRTQYNQTRTNTLLEFYLNYTKTFAEIHKIEVMAGYTWQDWMQKDKMYPTKYYDGRINAEAGISVPPHNRLISFFGRANYNLAEKYLLTATIRYDGSSRFSPENRWGLFPSVAAAWRINQEGFLKDVEIISNLKLRVGYGVTGQQDLNSDFGWLPVYQQAETTASVQFGDQYYQGWRPNGYDSNRKWEQTATTNIGLDWGFANDRYYGSIDVYQKHTTDLLNEVPVPAGSNFAPFIVRNIGEMDNWGVEATIGAVLINTEDIQWDINLNATWNKTKIGKLSLNDGPESDYRGIQLGAISGGTGNFAQIHAVGWAPSTFFLFEQVYDENGKPIEGVYVDQDDNGIINDEDLRMFGKPAPDWYFGFQTSFTYKNWSLSTALRASLGNMVYNNVDSDMGNFSQTLNPNTFLMNNLADGLNSGFYNRQLMSDYYLRDASFVKMDYIQLGYDFGKVIGGEIGLRATFTIQNVFTLTRYNGIDPEMASGLDNNYYPIPRTFMLGLSLNF